MNCPSAETVKLLICNEINMFYVDEPDQYDRAETLTDWKIWLWLEKQGYDFESTSLEPYLKHFLKETYQPISPESERTIMFSIRNIMRRILGLGDLSQQDLLHLIENPPSNNVPNWIYSEAITIVNPSLYSQFYHYVDSFVERVSSSRNGELVKQAAILKNKNELISFEDSFTENGLYILEFNERIEQAVCRMLIQEDFNSMYVSYITHQDAHLYGHIFNMIVTRLVDQFERSDNQ